MADEDEDKSSKTEEPSERKLTKAREQGNVPKSREVNNFFVLLAIDPNSHCFNTSLGVDAFVKLIWWHF